jgi:predicted nucleic acid-binding protein
VIVLDTNVLSALMQREPDRSVLAWIDGLPAESVWTTSITVFEIRFGLELLVSGRRRRQLESAFDEALEEDLGGRVLSFGPAEADAAAAIAAAQRRAGHPVEIRDVQIAGIVAARKGTLATRNTKHFGGIGLPLVDPWSP